MISNLISSSVLLFDIMDRYGVASEDFVTRAPNWITACVKDLGYAINLEPTSYETKYNHGRCLLPKFCEVVTMVVINGNKINYNELLYSRDAEVNLNRGVGLVFNDNDGEVDSLDIDVNEADYSKVSAPFYRISNGWLHTNVESGYIEIIYKKYPTEFNEVLGLECPLIPDEFNTREAIIFFILKTMLMRGYVHPILSLKDNNPLINPGLAYERHKLQSRISLNAPNIDKRARYANPLGSLFGRRKPIYKPTVRELKEATELTVGDIVAPMRTCKYAIGALYDNPVTIAYSDNTPIAVKTNLLAGYNYLFISIPNDRQFTTSTNQSFEKIDVEHNIGTLYNNVFRSINKFYTDTNFEFTIELY